MDQGGIYKIVLYENIGIDYGFNADGSIHTITNTGDTLTLTDCEQLNYQSPFTLGSNRDLMFTTRIDFNYYELTRTTLESIEDLNNIFGWVGQFFFRNGQTFVLKTPLFYPEDEIDFNTNNTNTFNLYLEVQVPTNQKINLIKYDDTQGQEILAEDGFGILAEDGSNILTG
jgi:hypothetical protein